MRTLCFLTFSLPVLLYGQSAISFDPDSILVEAENQAEILLVGTFHFDYPGLDGHKTAEEDKIDVTAGKRAAEVRELIDYLARFRPTKIVVERRTGERINEEYRSYLAGDFELPRSEVYQLAFPLAERFGIKELIAGDSTTLSYDLHYHPDSAVLRPLMDEIFVDQPPGTDTSVHYRYMQLYDHDDKLTKEHSLLEVFRYRNSPQRIVRGHGHYLEFNADPDADALALWWYSRNLRIYRKIQRVTEPGDRILVLFGAGHMSILRQQFESSPRYILTDFAEL